MREDEAKRRAMARAAREAEQQGRDVAVLLDQVEFRRFLRRYLARCNVFQSTFTGNSETFFREGQRSIGTTMFGEVMAVAPQRFAQIMAEKMPEDVEPPADKD